MSSVSEQLRSASLERLQALSPWDRIELTARLAEWDLDLFCAATLMPREAARAWLAARRQSGRQPSLVMRQEGR